MQALSLPILSCTKGGTEYEGETPRICTTLHDRLEKSRIHSEGAVCPVGGLWIGSSFKLIQDLLAPSNVKGKSKFKLLMDKLPGEHKARWFAGAALNSSEQAMNSVMSTAMSRLNAFLDSELEQILCFDTSIDVEHFCSRKSAIYMVLPEEDATKHFLISLIFQQLYREMLTVADEKGGQLDKRVMFYMDEIGSATRS